LHPEKEFSLAGSEKLACHFSFHMLVLAALGVWIGTVSLGAGADLVTVRTGAGLVTVRTAAGLVTALDLVTALELCGALQALTARTAAMTQVIFHLMSLRCPALSRPPLSSRPRPGLG
jgi:hypothetical protein